MLQDLTEHNVLHEFICGKLWDVAAGEWRSLPTTLQEKKIEFSVPKLVCLGIAFGLLPPQRLVVKH